MAVTELFASPAGSTPLPDGQHQIASFGVGDYSSIRVYAYVREGMPAVILYLINPDLHDNVGDDPPEAGVLDKIDLGAGEGHSNWYPLPGLNLAIEAHTSGDGSIDLFVYGET